MAETPRGLVAFVQRLFGGGRRAAAADDVQELYDRERYVEAYSRHTDLRVEENSQDAIGGMWEEIGRLQFEFVVRNGLAPHHTLLDIGCGTLRGGRHFIRHLAPRHYTGMDISPKAIEAGRRLVREEGLAEKEPRLLVSERKDLTFREFPGETFDFLLAQSVFTHLPAEHIDECFRRVGGVMHDRSVFFFTYVAAESAERTSLKDFRYPFTFFEGLASRYGFTIRERADDYPHPRGQRMVELRKTGVGSR